jgi:AraC-like DNA-binding protein
MRKLSDMTPFVGNSMPYVYDGSSNERLRTSNVYAFHLFTDGPGEMEIDGKRYPVEARTLVFLRPGQPHAFHISPRHPLPSYNLYFELWKHDPSTWNHLFFRFPEVYRPETAVPIPACEELDALPGVFSLRPFPHLYEQFQMIAKLFEESRFYRNETSGSLLYAFMLSWYNAIHARQPSDYRIVRLLASLNAEPENRESVEEWWRQCGLKRTYFHELFLKETGLTPKAYRHRLLMKKAAQLLQESSLSVTAISEKLGYSSIHPFTRHFGTYFGVSPKQFRQNPRVGHAGD